MSQTTLAKLAHEYAICEAKRRLAHARLNSIFTFGPIAKAHAALAVKNAEMILKRLEERLAYLNRVVTRSGEDGPRAKKGTPVPSTPIPGLEPPSGGLEEEHDMVGGV